MGYTTIQHKAFAHIIYYSFFTRHIPKPKSYGKECRDIRRQKKLYRDLNSMRMDYIHFNNHLMVSAIYS